MSEKEVLLIDVESKKKAIESLAKRKMIMYMTPEILRGMLMDGENHWGVEDGLPCDARLVDVRLTHNPNDRIELIYESSEFPEQNEGAPLEEIEPLIRRIFV